MFSCKFTINSIDFSPDFEKDIQSQVKPYFSHALDYVGSEMIVNLQDHIRRDWYEKWGSPKQYIRRSDSPEYGTPIGSQENMDSHVYGDKLIFTFEPDTEHGYDDSWSGSSANSQVTPDDMIRIIQSNSGWRYPVNKDIHGRTIMPRPFWNNFVDEQENEKIIESFAAGISHDFTVIPDGAGKDVILDGTEKM